MTFNNRLIATSILDALKIAGRTTGNNYIEHNLNKVHQDVRMGKKLAFSLTKFTTGIFPSQTLKMIQVGESAGALGDMLSEIGEMMDAEVKDHVLKLTATLEPLAMAALISESLRPESEKVT